jgi:hypothetical protein
MSSHPKTNSAMEALSVNNRILLLALEPVGHTTPAADMLQVRPEGYSEDYQSGKGTGSQQLKSQFAMGQSYKIPDFNTRKTGGGGDLILADKAERAGKTVGSLFGRAAIFAKKWRIQGGPVARGWVWMQLLKEEVGIWGDWKVRNQAFDEDCILRSVGGADAAHWAVADVYLSLKNQAERAEAEAEAARAEAEAERAEALKSISPLCKMAITSYGVVQDRLSTLLPAAAEVGLLLLEGKDTEALEKYRYIAEDMDLIEVPELPKLPKKGRKPLPKFFEDMPKTSKSKPKKGKFDYSEGFKKILKIEGSKNA